MSFDLKDHVVDIEIDNLLYSSLFNMNLVFGESKRPNPFDILVIKSNIGLPLKLDVPYGNHVLGVLLMYSTSKSILYAQHVFVYNVKRWFRWTEICLISHSEFQNKVKKYWR